MTRFMNGAARNGVLLALAVFVADQTSKALFVARYAAPDQPGGVSLLPFLRLVYTENYGVSWGMMTAHSDVQRWVLVAITVVISIGAAAWLARESDRFEALGLGCIVGGAAGNVCDRVRHGFVTDFINVHFGGWSPFLVFNVADAAITIGVLILLARALLAKGRERERGDVRKRRQDNA